MSLINKFNVFFEKHFDTELVNDIKLFYITKHHLLYVTTNNSVYHYKLRAKQLRQVQPFFGDHVIIKVECSNDKSNAYFMALTHNGCVYSWGDNYWGQLGNGTKMNSRDQPTIINSLCDKFITDICCGHWHSLVLTRSGDVYTFGANSYGQCGNNSTENQLIPFRIAVSSVIAVSCGYGHSIALTDSGEVYGWGDNSDAQLGIETRKVNWFTKSLRQIGMTDGAKQLTPIKLNVPKIVQIMCGFTHTLMMSTDGDIYFCGSIYFCLSHKIPTIINPLTAKFTKIGATIHCNLCVALSADNVCYIFGKYGDNKEIKVKDVRQTEFTSIDETFAFYEQITLKTIEKDSRFDSMPSCPNYEMCQTLSFEKPLSLQTEIYPPLTSLIDNLDINTSSKDDYEYFNACLTRDESGFGLSIDGGAECGGNVVIGSILSGGVAHRNGVLRVGDELIAINVLNVTGRTHREVLQIMSQTDSEVSIHVRRKRSLHSTFI